MIISMAYGLLFTSIFVAVIGQALFKIGMMSQSSVNEAFWKVFLVPSVVLGLVLYFLSALLYIHALKTIPLSIAYPSLSLGYVVVVLLGLFLFDETLQRVQMLGVLVIVIGVMLLHVKK